MNKIFLLHTVALSAVLVGCASAPQWPAWVMDPGMDGVAAADCIPYSGNLSLDRQQIAAKARLSLAQQINIRIQGMDKTYQSRVDAGKAPVIKSSFESSSEQTVDTALNGARIKKFEIHTNGEGKFMCGQLVLEDGADKKLVQNVIRSKAVQVDMDTEEILLAKFRERSIASK